MTRPKRRQTAREWRLSVFFRDSSAGKIDDPAAIPYRVVAKGLDTRTTAVSEITTENPDTLTPDDFAMEALDVMQSRNFRHLPVTDGSKVMGMGTVSIQDLFAAVKMSLEEDIRETGALVFGDQYGA